MEGKEEIHSEQGISCWFLRCCCFTHLPYLKSSCQKLVLHLQEVALVGLCLERFVDDSELRVILDVLPPRITMATERSEGSRFVTVSEESLRIWLKSNLLLWKKKHD